MDDLRELERAVAEQHEQDLYRLQTWRQIRLLMQGAIQLVCTQEDASLAHDDATQEVLRLVTTAAATEPGKMNATLAIKILIFAAHRLSEAAIINSTRRADPASSDGGDIDDPISI